MASTEEIKAETPAAKASPGKNRLSELAGKALAKSAKNGIDLKTDVTQLDRVGGRAGADTIRLWESYREQAYLWRALCLLQMPATALSILAALVMYFYADTIIEVPQRPEPGRYSVSQLPDTVFIDAATSVVNLMATYQPTIARRQFRTARKYLWEPALTQFERDILGSEIKTIEESKRSQIFFINTRLVRVDRYPEREEVVVRLPGVRQKLLAGEAIPPDEKAYYVTMTTIPKNVSNEYGIVVTGISLREIDEQSLLKEDNKEARANKRMTANQQAQSAATPAAK